MAVISTSIGKKNWKRTKTIIHKRKRERDQRQRSVREGFLIFTAAVAIITTTITTRVHESNPT